MIMLDLGRLRSGEPPKSARGVRGLKAVRGALLSQNSPTNFSAPEPMPAARVPVAVAMVNQVAKKWTSSARFAALIIW